MRKLLMCGSLLLLASCGGNPDVSPVVSFGYGAGNGDGVQFPGPAPKTTFADGVGNDVPVSSGLKYTRQYGYGADEDKGAMVSMAPAPKQQVAAPAPGTLPAGAAPGTHI